MRQPNRRDLLKTAALASAIPSPAASNGTVDWAAVRNDFPWLKNRLWLTAADYHPLTVHSQTAMEEHIRYRVHGEGDYSSSPFHAREAETKQLFAELINARPSEIAFVQSTTEGENLVVAGLRLNGAKGANVVIDDLHYQASKYMYRMLEREHGVQLRIARLADRNGFWTVRPDDMEKLIDNNTRLVSLALVSNINGFLHDIKRTSEIAHARGAYVYCDIIQGAGAVPIDVRAMGIDFAACGAYKWLMGDFGFGFLYVRDDLQAQLQRSRYGVRQYTSLNNTQTDSAFKLREGASKFETGSFSYVGGAAVHAALKYIKQLGVTNIRDHARDLTNRLQAELPRMGYKPLTPPGNETPIVSYQLPEYEKTAAKLKKTFGKTVIALRRWEFADNSGEVRIIPGMRISPSVYNNKADVDRLLEALS